MHSLVSKHTSACSDRMKLQLMFTISVLFALGEGRNGIGHSSGRSSGRGRGSSHSRGSGTGSSLSRSSHSSNSNTGRAQSSSPFAGIFTRSKAVPPGSSSPDLYRPRNPPSYDSHRKYPVVRPPPPSYEQAVGIKPYQDLSSYAPNPVGNPRIYQQPSVRNRVLENAAFYGFGHSRAMHNYGQYQNYHPRTGDWTLNETTSSQKESVEENVNEANYEIKLNDSIAELPFYGFEHLNWNETYIVPIVVPKEPTKPVRGFGKALGDALLSLSNWLFRPEPQIKPRTWEKAAGDSNNGKWIEYRPLENEYLYDVEEPVTEEIPWWATTTTRKSSKFKSVKEITEFYSKDLSENLAMVGRHAELLANLENLTPEEKDELDELSPKVMTYFESLNPQ